MVTHLRPKLAKLGLAILATAAFAQPVGNMSQLMINIIYPTSDAIFYVDRDEPKNEVQWNALANQALMLAESGNLLLMPGRARDQGEWVKDAKMMIDAGAAAFKAAQAKDMDGIVALSEQLSNSCIACHLKYRPGYGKK